PGRHADGPDRSVHRRPARRGAAPAHHPDPCRAGRLLAGLDGRRARCPARRRRSGHRGPRAPRPGSVMRTLVVVPTYDERESLPVLLDGLRAAAPEVDGLVVEDASPDGTGELAARRASEDDRVHVLHRAGKGGLGAAYVAGFGWGLDRGYDVLCEMDADGSHRPEELARLLGRLAADDAPALVIGSRWVPGGRVVDWPWHRLLLSRAGNTYVRLALGIGVRDATGGFRAFRAATLRGLELAQVESHGYCFQVDMT